MHFPEGVLYKITQWCILQGGELYNITQWCTFHTGELYNITQWCIFQAGELYNITQWCILQGGELYNITQWCIFQAGELYKITQWCIFQAGELYKITQKLPLRAGKGERYSTGPLIKNTYLEQRLKPYCPRGCKRNFLNYHFLLLAKNVAPISYFPRSSSAVISSSFLRQSLIS